VSQSSLAEPARRGAPPLDPRTRARGRRLAIASHPAGMTFRTVFTEWIPTLALVGLGASETVVGLQSAFDPLGHLVQLRVLRSVGRRAKRTLLLLGQGIGVAGAVPLLAYGWLHAAPGPASVAVVLASLAVVTVGIAVTETVWFPLLRSYVEPGQVGRFFGTIRSFWHLTLLLARLPERSERTGQLIRLRVVIPELRRHPRLRRYLLGVGGQGAIWSATIPFVIVLMRRVVGLSEAQVLMTTVAVYAGGLASLYPWGRIIDAVGPARVFRWTSLGLAACFLSLLGVREPGPWVAVGLTAFFFAAAVLRAGFGVADTHVLFELAPEDSPASLIVVATAVTWLPRGIAPLAVGFALDRILGLGVPPIVPYHGLFVLAAALQALVFLPLREFGRPGEP
jgi:hypothetical protein